MDEKGENKWLLAYKTISYNISYVILLIWDSIKDKYIDDSQLVIT